LALVTQGCAVDGGTARFGRAVVFASSSVCLAWAAHVAGGAARPPAAIMAIALVLLTRVAFGFAGRERRLPALLAGQAVTQILLHLTFVLAHPHSHPASGPSLDLRMTLVHSIATVCVALLLGRGERVLWFVAQLQPRTIVMTLLPPVSVVAIPPVAPTMKINLRRRQPRPHTRPLGRRACRRGPPAPPLPGSVPLSA
jgi:hypothetical protein